MADSVLDTWAHRAGLRRSDDTADARAWVGLESAYRLAAVGDAFEVFERDRGSERSLARLATRSEAELFLLLTMAMPWRSQRGYRMPFPPGFPDGVVLAAADEGFELVWAGGSAWFRSESDARRFSRVRMLDLAGASELLEAP